MIILTTLFWMSAVMSTEDGIAKPQDVVYSPQRAFRIPLDVSSEERQGLASIRLYVSEDRGRTWLRHSDGSPDAEVITFRARHDGEYWFSIAMVDQSGRQSPEDVHAVGPGLKVVVDTTRPLLDVRAIRSKSGRRGVRWTVDDVGSSDGPIRMAAWDEGSGSWTQVDPAAFEKGMIWFEDGESVRKVQVWASDGAGNASVVEVEVMGDQFTKREVDSFVLDVRESSEMIADQRPTHPTPNDSAVQRVSHSVTDDEKTTASSPVATFCSSRQIVVNYEMDTNSKPASRVELWATRDGGRTWALAGVDVDGKSPAEATLDSEGVYGLRIVLSDSNLPSPGPESGTAPEMTIAVDSTPPVVAVTEAVWVGDAIRVRWQLQEANPTETPISVFVGPSEAGPWQPVAQGLGNTGEHTFPVGPTVAGERVFVRLEAHDRAQYVGQSAGREVVRPGTGN